MSIALVAAATCMQPMVAAAAAPASTTPPGPQTSTLWRGVLKGDSLFVRADWLPTVGSSSCYRPDLEGSDTSEVRRKFVGYRVEDARGKVWDRGVISDSEAGQFCCDNLFAGATPWPGRLILKLDAFGWGCEPAGDCSASRFSHIAGPDSVATSDWTEIRWDPEQGSFTEAWVTQNCIEYGMRLEARVQGATLEFAPTFPPGVKEGDLLEKKVNNEDEDFVECLRPFRPVKPTSVAWYPTPDSKSPERTIIRPEESVEIVSALIRAERSRSKRLVPVIVRLGVRVADRSGFLTPSDLRALGFHGL